MTEEQQNVHGADGGSWEQVSPILFQPSPHLGDDAQDSSDPLRSVKAAGVGAHSLQDTAHKIQVMDWLHPQGATELQAHSGQMDKK